MSKPVNVLIVEDEFLTADSIKVGLEEIGYSITGLARDSNEALTFLEKKETDIAILDINIQGSKDGIWLAKEIREKFNIPFIFLTAYSDTNTVKQALDARPFSFLIKPFSKIDLYTSIELALKNFVTEEQQDPERSPHVINDYLFVKEKHFYSKIFISEILYVKSELKYIQIFTSSQSYLLRYNLIDLHKVLPQDLFFQPHRSFIVNRDAIDKIGSNFLVVMDTEIPISTSRKEEVKKMFNFIS